MSAVRPRLAATERRAAVLQTACRVFSQGSYRGTTTAEIAREAGVSEPILYRHFASKRDLYLACIDEAWRQVRAIWEAALAQEGDGPERFSAMGRALHASKEKYLLSSLWVQALTEASEDPEIRRHMRRHLRDVNDYVSGVITRAQDAGWIQADRDAVAEAWIFIAVGLLGAIGQRLGGLAEPDIERIRTSRRRWLAGT
jgi:TetR/AcrR family transcriptional regulator